MTSIDTLARRHAVAVRATTEGVVPPPFTPPPIPRRYVGLVNVAAVVAAVVLLVGLSLLLSYFLDENPVVTPNTTVVTVPDSTLPESSGWPRVTGAEFIPAPSRGPVGGVPTAPVPDLGGCERCSLTVLDDGRVLMVTGYRAFLFDTGSETWTKTSAPPVGGGGLDLAPNSVRLDDGRVLVTGLSHPVMVNETGVAQVYDPASGTFQEIGPVPKGSVPVVTSDGRVLIVAGRQSVGLFDPIDNSVSAPAEGWVQGSESERLKVVPLLDGRVMIFGAGSPRLYDPASSVFDDLHPGSGVHSMEPALLPDGRVLATGGFSVIGEDIPSAEAGIFDPATGEYTDIGQMLQLREGHQALTLPDGRVLIVGGAGDTAEVYDPAKNRFVDAPAMTRDRSRLGAVVLDDGRVLIVGGMGNWIDWPSGHVSLDDSARFMSAEFYDPDGNNSQNGCCDTGMIGFSLGFEVEIDSTQRAQAAAGELSLVVKVEVPPGGWDGLHSTRFNSWHLLPGGAGGSGPIQWSFAPGFAPDWCADSPDCTEIEDDCADGCEILYELDPEQVNAAFLGVSLDVNYLAGIPAEAAGITMTIIDGG